MAELDVKDRKLIYYLSNGKLSNSQISKKLLLSKNSVGYRINRLVQKGIIKNFTTTINLGSLNLTTFTLFLKFNEDITEKKEIAEYFKKHKFSCWVAVLSGQWDLFVEMVSFDFSHMNGIVEEILDFFGELVNSYKICFSRDTLRVEHLIEDFYSDLNLPAIPHEKRITEKVSIDKTDKLILKKLSQDSSKSYLSIAEELKLTFDIVQYRIKNLMKKGVIIKLFPEIDLSKLGYTEYLYFINLKNISKTKLLKIKEKFKCNPNISYAFFDVIGFNLVFVCAFRNSDQIDHLSRSLRKEYGDIINEQNYYILKEHLLFNLFPEGI